MSFCPNSFGATESETNGVPPHAMWTFTTGPIRLMQLHERPIPGAMSRQPKAFTRLALMARGIDNREHCEAARFGSGLFSRREPETGQQKLALLRIAIRQSNFEPLSAETNALAGW